MTTINRLPPITTHGWVHPDNIGGVDVRGAGTFNDKFVSDFVPLQEMLSDNEPAGYCRAEGSECWDGARRASSPSLHKSPMSYSVVNVRTSIALLGFLRCGNRRLENNIIEAIEPDAFKDLVSLQLL